MEENHAFKTVGEMALRYFDRSDGVGRRRFWRRVERDPLLMQTLMSLGFQKGDKIFSPKMVQAMAERWG
jgi:hypothetical protein